MSIRVSKDLIKLTKAILNDSGAEMNNPLPLEIPSGLNRPLSLQERIQRMLRVELSRQAEEQGHETFEEADDFDIDDGFDVEDPATPYEMTTMQEEYIAEVATESTPETAPPEHKEADQALEQGANAEVKNKETEPSDEK